MHQLPDLESGNFDIRHLESLRGFDIKRPSNKYGGEWPRSKIKFHRKRYFIHSVSIFVKFKPV
jgi:hypothetical protein